MRLSREFDRIQATSLDILERGTALNPDVKTALASIIQNAYLPNVEWGFVLKRLSTPQAYRDTGRAALLPVKRYGEVCVDPGDTIYNAAGMDDRNRLARDLALMRKEKTTLSPELLASTSYGRGTIGNQAYKGSSLILMRASKDQGELAAVAIHEATHVHLGRDDPNLKARLSSPAVQARLRHLEEAECGLVELALAPLTGEDPVELREELNRHVKQAGHGASPTLDLSNFYYMRAFPNNSQVP